MVHALHLLLWIFSAALAEALWPHMALAVAACCTEASQRGTRGLTSTAAVGHVGSTQGASTSSVGAETEPLALFKDGVITHSKPISPSALHARKPAEPRPGVSNTVRLPGPPAGFPQHEEAAVHHARLVSGPHNRTLGDERLRFKKYCALSLVFLAAVLWLVVLFEPPSCCGGSESCFRCSSP